MSTNDFTNEYKKKVDALQTLYRFKGNVETLAELNSKTDNNIGDVWKCKEDGNNYCWNRTEWVDIGTDIDLSNCATKTELEEKVETTTKELKKEIQEVSDTVITDIATQEKAGLMSKEDKAKLDNYVGGVTGDTLPIGSIQEWPSNIIPNNWLLCNGQAVSRTDYPELFAVLGTTYGEGDGSTTFNLPNFKGRVGVGKDDDDSDFNALGKTAGEKTHALTVEEMPSHKHDIRCSSIYEANDTGYFQIVKKEGYSENPTHTINGTETTSAGENQPHNNLQPYIVVNYIIKAHQSAGVVAEVIQEDGEASTENVYSANAVKSIVESIVEEINKTKLDANIVNYISSFEDATISNYEPYGNTYYYKVGSKVHLHIRSKNGYNRMDYIIYSSRADLGHYH